MGNQSVTMNQIIHCSLAVTEYSSSKLSCGYVTTDKLVQHKRSYSRTGRVQVLNRKMNGDTNTVFQKLTAQNILELGESFNLSEVLAIDVDFFNSRFL